MRKILKHIRDFVQHKVYMPGNLRVLIRTCAANEVADSRSVHMDAAMKWLCFAQDKSSCGGVSAGYSFQSGWQLPYPETTGYIIETFYDYAMRIGNNSYRFRSRQMLDWLISIQYENGAFPGGLYRADKAGNIPDPVVFNTGMILFGLVRGFNEEQDEKYLHAARRAGDWLIECQDEDGAWRKCTYKNMVHAYKTRVAWALLQLWKIAGDARYRDAAIANLEWCISRQAENGFVSSMSFFNEAPYTHTIAYTARGLLESGIILDDRRYISAAMKIAWPLLYYFEINKKLPGQFDAAWKPAGNYICMTGCAQMAIIWMKIFRHGSDARYLNASLKMNDFLVQKHCLTPAMSHINGAIMGSSPIWGDYMSYYFPNWAAKFFVESLLLEVEITKELDVRK